MQFRKHASKATSTFANGNSWILRLAPLALGLLPATLHGAVAAQGTRSVFINGTDISSARSQELRNVDLIINERGDIFIVAPHYQVNEEDTYVPLSQYIQGAAASPVQHKAPQAAAAQNGPMAANLAPQKTTPNAASRTEMGSTTGGPGAFGEAQPLGDSRGAEATAATSGETKDGVKEGSKSPGTNAGGANADKPITMPTAESE